MILAPIPAAFWPDAAVHMRVLCKLARGVQMGVHVGARKSQEGQFPGYPEKRISGFYSEHPKDTSSPFGYTQKALSCSSEASRCIQ